MNNFIRINKGTKMKIIDNVHPEDIKDAERIICYIIKNIIITVDKNFVFSI